MAPDDVGLHQQVADYVAKALASAPPLSPAQIDRVVALMDGTAGRPSLDAA